MHLKAKRRVMTNWKSYLENDAYNRSTSLRELGQLHASSLKHSVALAKVEGEATLLRHG